MMLLIYAAAGWRYVAVNDRRYGSSVIETGSDDIDRCYGRIHNDHRFK